ncbi:unnamed protein product [Gadus morhua 'NCC']
MRALSGSLRGTVQQGERREGESAHKPRLAAANRRNISHLLGQLKVAVCAEVTQGHGREGRVRGDADVITPVHTKSPSPSPGGSEPCVIVPRRVRTPPGVMTTAARRAAVSPHASPEASLCFVPSQLSGG